ncbi:MAG: ABC transporter ATP-binding protein [Parcubacteria group bacterium QH_9_35_7]|nr:MAG: ABC transporter ATP-binding protein [Parcubacteria group bacterium QH_9_35_7]
MSTKALKIQNLTKTYGDLVAVDNLDLEIEKGEFFGFLGPNGAGKSTTIHSITGIATFDSGSIEVYGYDVVEEFREARNKIGLSPQEFNVDIFMQVWKIIWFMGGYYGIEKQRREERMNRLLDTFGLKEHKDKRFKDLSGGLKRRVLLARAMIHDPEFIILDEPTEGVDVELRHELWDYMNKLNEQGHTIFLTSHYIEEVEALCERVAIINQGELVEVGKTEELMKNKESLEEKYLEVTHSYQ